ncbi:MAG TPA: GNAT family N-acetyltransferase, partial [Chloroflexia bacterium]|nr:GNAT family N-acetyltransferase [Chloroflexia bacterium]
MAFEIQCVSTFAEGPSDETWRDLLGAAAAHPVFLSRQFQQAWWNAFCFCSSASCPTQLALLLLSEGGTLVGVAPFYWSCSGPAEVAEEQARARDWPRIVARAAREPDPGLPPAPRPGERMLRLVGGVAVADYLDIIAPRGREAEVWAAVGAYWAAQAERWDVLDLHSLPPAAAAWAAQAAAGQGWQTWSAVEETCPAVALPGDWESYLAQLGKKDRHELRRKLRRIEAPPVVSTWQIARAGVALAHAFDEFLALHRLSSAAKAEFMTAEMLAFFRSLLATFAATGQLEVATLYIENQPAAAYLSFRQNDQLLLYNAGYDPQYAGLGAGFALLVYRIQAAIAEGITVL